MVNQKEKRSLEYNVPIQVTKEQYNLIMDKYAQSCAGREANGVFEIKLWDMRYKNLLTKILF